MYSPRVHVAPFRNKVVIQAKKERIIFFYDGNYFFTLMRIMGCFPMTKIDGHIRFKWKSLSTAYTVLFLLLSSGFSVWCLYTVLKNLREKSFNFEDGAFYCSFAMVPALQILLLLTFLEARKLASYLDAWADYQVIFERLVKVKLHVNFVRGWFLVVFTGPILMTIASTAWENNFKLLIENYQLEPTAHVIFLRGFFLCTMWITLYGFLWFIFSRNITNTAELLIRDIESLRWTANRSIKNHMFLWFHLRQLCINFCSPLSWSYLYLIGVFFGVSLPMLYIAAIHVQNGDYFTLIASFNSLLFISCLADYAHRPVEKVSTEFESRMTALLTKVNDPECEKELLEFIEKIVTYPVVVSLGGFFQLDRTLNSSVYSAVITYLIIIIQFRGSKFDGAQVDLMAMSKVAHSTPKV